MQILQLASAQPRDEFSTEELIGAFPCKLPASVKQNIANLGVQKRHLIDYSALGSRTEHKMDETALVDLCVEACGKSIDKAHFAVSDIGYFIAAYDVMPFLTPGLSQLAVRSIGFDSHIRHVNVQGVASTAFPKSLELAGNYLAAHPEDHVLICVSGVSSYWFHNQVRGLKSVMDISQISHVKSPTKRERELRKWVATMEYFLFGDGVSACIVGREGKGLSVKGIVEVTNMEKRHYLAGYARLYASDTPFKFGFYAHLDKEIPKLGAEYTGAALKQLLGRNASSIAKKAKKWAVHTGSEKILNVIAERHGIEEKKLRESHTVLRECGNLAGASLPFILERIISGTRFSKGDVALMVGYGWGFSAAACLLEYQA